MTQALLVLASLSLIFLSAIYFPRKKARPNSTMISRDGKHWMYLRKVKNGYLFRDPNGRIKTLINTNIFKGYKFK